jgi:hypothetical protein
MTSIIPPSLAPFLQEYELHRMNPERDSATLIERTLQFGNRAELQWLFTQYSHQQITEWLQSFGRERLPQPHLDFWRIVLENPA